MKSKVFCFASAKGGSGKTIISANLGTALAHLGKKVLLIDADGSTNGMTLLYLESVLQARDAADQSTEPLGIFNNGHASGLAVELQPNLWLLPATFVMTETHTITADDFDRNLQTAISRYGQEFDYIIIDAQAGIEDFALAAIRQSDRTVIVSEYDPISEKGIARFRKMISSDQSPMLLFNKVLPEFVSSIGDPLGLSGVLPPIPWNADVVRAYVQGKLALNMEKGNIFTIGMLRTASALFGRDIQDLVEKWRKDKDDFIRAPHRKQLEDVSNELESVQKTRVSAEFEANSGARVSIYFWMLAALITIVLSLGFTYSTLLDRELSNRVDNLNEYMTRVNEDIKLLAKMPVFDTVQHKKLLAERVSISEERQATEYRIRAIANMRLIMIGIIVALFGFFAAYYIWRRSAWEQRRLELLKEVVIHSDKIDDLRSKKSQLMAYEQFSLDELLKRDV